MNFTIIVKRPFILDNCSLNTEEAGTFYELINVKGCAIKCLLRNIQVKYMIILFKQVKSVIQLVNGKANRGQLGPFWQELGHWRILNHWAAHEQKKHALMLPHDRNRVVLLLYCQHFGNEQFSRHL